MPSTTRHTRTNQSRSAANDGSAGKQIGRWPTLYLARSAAAPRRSTAARRRRRGGAVRVSVSFSWQPKISTGTSSRAWRTVQAAACSSPKLTAPITIPCTLRRRNNSAQTRPPGGSPRSRNLVCSGQGTTTSIPAASWRRWSAAAFGGQLGAETAAIGRQRTESHFFHFETHGKSSWLVVGRSIQKPREAFRASGKANPERPY